MRIYGYKKLSNPLKPKITLSSVYMHIPIS